MVRKSEKPSHFQECFASPGISNIPLSSLSFVSVKGPQHFLVTWSMIRRFISRESWFKNFLLVIKITMINSDFKIFSLNRFPMGSKDRTREDGGNWTYTSTWTNFLFQRDLGEWTMTSTDLKRDSWTILFWIFSNCIAFKMYAMFSNHCGLVLTGHGVYTGRSTQDGNRRSLYRSLSASNPGNGYLRDFCSFI